MGQAADLIFEQIVADAQTHDVHSGRFTDGSGQQHKRRGIRAVAYQLPYIQGRKAGQVVVRQNQIKDLALQRAAHILQAIDRRDLAGQLCLPEAEPGQGLICDRVFNMKDFQGLIRSLHIAKGAIIGYILEH